MAKQSVLILGATGGTGMPIVDGLLESGNFNVIAGSRPSSTAKPEAEVLKSRGVEIRAIDLENWNIDRIAASLKGVDVVVSALYYSLIPLQRKLADACKKVGIKRFVPDDWASACVRGVRELHDQKLAIHDYVKEIGLNYTFIDVGMWMEGIPPFSKTGFHRLSPCFIGTGNVKNATTDRRDLGKFVARILADERTLNQYVFCWTEHVTLDEAVAIAERVSGRKVELDYVSEEEIAQLVKAASGMDKHAAEYMYSFWVRGDNTVANAKKEEYGGALDARELYPDIGKELKTFEEFAKEFYSK